MRRSSTSSDSLDLLLGPMCNTFGILVLVACITALIAGQSGSGNDGDGAATTALQERRVAVAMREREALLEQLKSAGASGNPELSAKAAEIQRLQEVLKTLQQHSSELEKHLTQEARSHAADPGADLHKLNEELHASKLQQQDLNNTASALTEQIQEGAGKLKDLEGQKSKLVESRTVHMRFPKEHETSRTPTPIIVRYGKIFPISLADGTLNPALKHTPVGVHSVLVEPISARGWTLLANHDDLVHLLEVCKATHSYISLYAYPDSFQLCRDLRELVAKQGVDFGLKPEGASRQLVFSSEGSPLPTL